MPKVKDKKVLRVEEISSGILDENNARIVEIGIPGRGKVNIKISFEKEEKKEITPDINL